MKLLKLRLKRFKKFVDFSCEFAPGINLVKGPCNEVGKSTLVEGLCTALLANPKSMAKALDDYVSWGQSQRYETTVEFDDEGGCYRLEKDFETKSVALTDLATGEKLDTPKSVEQKMESLLGIASERLFFATCCIRQGDVAGIASGKEKISESLERAVTGEDVLVSKISRSLVKAISALSSTGPKNPGKIPKCQSDLGQLDAELGDARGKVDRVETARLDLVAAREVLSDVAYSLTLKKKLLEKNKRRLQVEQNIATYKGEYQKMDETLEAAKQIFKAIADGEQERDRIDQKLGAIPGFGDAQLVAEVKKKLSEVRISRDNLRSDLQKRTEEERVVASEMDKKRFLQGLASRFPLIVGFGVTLFGAIGILFSVASVAGVILGLLLVVIHMWARSALSQLKTKHEGLTERILSMEKAVEKLATEEVETLRRIGCDSIDQFTARGNESESLHKTRDALEHRLEGYRYQLLGKIGNKSLDDIEGEGKEIRLKLLLEQDKLTEDLRNSAVDGEKYVALQNEVAGLETKSTELSDTVKKCNWTIESAERTPEDVAALEERADTLRRMLVSYQDRQRIYELTKDFVNRARNETLRSARETLESEVQQNFSTFTQGKYNRVRLVGEELQFQIYSDEKGDWVYPEKLSRGTIDEFYLACRIALVRLICGDSKPPLVLDDPLVNFDGLRLQETLNYLDTLARDYQIVLLTLGDVYDPVADQVIVLGG